MTRVSYWVIVPEFGADDVVAAMSNSWFKAVSSHSVHYCVANNTNSNNGALHRLPLERATQTPRDRSSFFSNGMLLDARRRELYNSFLRLKVFLMLRAMSDDAYQGLMDYAMLLDADTAINASNVFRFVSAIPGGGDARIYTGRCLQQSLEDHQAIAHASLHSHDVAKFVELYKRRGKAALWPLTTPPSPGGGPGLLFSRGLLASIRGQLQTCRELAQIGAFGNSIFSGGDSMLTRCLAMLGTRCANEHDLRIDRPNVCPFHNGCALVSLFRKNPPWFYVAAGHNVRNMQLVQRAQPDSVLGLSSPLEETIAFHHVKPTIRVRDMSVDPRCAVRLRTDPHNRAGWWGSTCMPHFCMIGVNHAGIHQLHASLTAHPDVVMPARKALHFFSSPGRVQQLLADLNWTHHAASRLRGKDLHPLSTRLLRMYANMFPTIDPRDFKLTGEASAGYFYEPAAPLLFSHAHLIRMRTILILRHPVARALAEFTGRRQGELTVRALGLIETARQVHLQCGLVKLYNACGSSCPKAGSRSEQSDGYSVNNGLSRNECAEARQVLHDRVGEWRALWRSWYHLFLPPWLQLGTRILVQFTDDFEHPHLTHKAYQKLATFLRLPPVLFEARSKHSRVPITNEENTSRSLSLLAEHFNVSGGIVVALRGLTLDSTLQTSALLTAAGHPGVPPAWAHTDLAHQLPKCAHRQTRVQEIPGRSAYKDCLHRE